MSKQKNIAVVDCILVGAGIMSTTLGVFLKELNPDLHIELIETASTEAQESSGSWNNAGTGHAANCELNYTPLQADGTVNISKALEVNEEFDLSRQFWSYLVKKGAIQDPASFIHPVPHMSFVQGDANVCFLKKRHAVMSAHHCWRDMEYSEDPVQIAKWIPLVIHGRDPQEKIAATHILSGADVSYGALTSNLLSHLNTLKNFKATFLEQVIALRRETDGFWCVTIKNQQTGNSRSVKARFVFLGAGGAALTLLQKSGISAAEGYAGLPVSGIWLRCDTPEVTEQHHAKVYGLAGPGSPPMSAPHLDTRLIDGRRSILFGPYAGISLKFLKKCSWLDFVQSLRPHNILPLIAVGLSNFALVKYLIGQILLTKNGQLNTLRAFYPKLNPKDWYLQTAGMRVQIIKKDLAKVGILEFGTEIVESADSSIVSLLGASPGASTSVCIMMNVIEKMGPTGLLPSHWKTKMQQMIPSYGHSLISNADLCLQLRAETAKVLGLHHA